MVQSSNTGQDDTKARTSSILWPRALSHAASMSRLLPDDMDCCYRAAHRRPAPAAGWVAGCDGACARALPLAWIGWIARSGTAARLTVGLSETALGLSDFGGSQALRQVAGQCAHAWHGGHETSQRAGSHSQLQLRRLRQRHASRVSCSGCVGQAPPCVVTVREVANTSHSETEGGRGRPREAERDRETELSRGFLSARCTCRARR